MKNVLDFLTQNPVFTREALVNFLANQGSISPNTQKAILQYHLKQGHIARIKRGLFAAIPPGSNPNTHPVDPYLIAGKATSDAILSYHTALEYHGLAYTVFSNFTFCSRMRLQPFTFQGHIFEAAPFPGTPMRNESELFATETVKRQGLAIKITTLERTFVDVLDQPNRGGDWEEIYRSIQSITVMNLDLIIEYTLRLEKATTTAKVGYFLEKLGKRLGITERQLQPLKKQLPKKPHYLSRNQRKGGAFIKQWNLIVPEHIAEEQWDEPTYDD
jgi:predicted transcriptional regulator of viral defense system